ncbi:MAG: helix-turn-helix transcriptional regulator [Coriobacteriia bacterium]|nr:helix-turn-helix transcriptional regulator [Coriobacteriia bacterium]
MHERDWSLLSGREKQILDLLSANMSSKEIAAKLGLCRRTIDNHCVNIIRKLQVSDRFEAARLWQRYAE